MTEKREPNTLRDTIEGAIQLNRDTRKGVAEVGEYLKPLAYTFGGYAAGRTFGRRFAKRGLKLPKSALKPSGLIGGTVGLGTGILATGRRKRDTTQY